MFIRSFAPQHKIVAAFGNFFMLGGSKKRGKGGERRGEREREKEEKRGEREEEERGKKLYGPTVSAVDGHYDGPRPTLSYTNSANMFRKRSMSLKLQYSVLICLY
jgi:hypothetical protein